MKAINIGKHYLYFMAEGTNIIILNDEIKVLDELGKFFIAVLNMVIRRMTYI